MANAENLKKGKATQFKSGKDAVENGRKAGVASGASRRRKRAMRQAAAMLLNTQIPMNERGPFMGTVKTLLKTFGYTPDDATYGLPLCYQGRQVQRLEARRGRRQGQARLR